jgi:DNA-binding transcriptional regulator YiaG
MVPSSSDTAGKRTNNRSEKKGKNRINRTKSKVQLSKEQQELVDIKNTLGLRHQDFAIMLDIGLPRLSSYTYGRTATVPPEIMKTARQLLAENSRTSMQIRKKFSRPMSEILDEWAEKLGTRSDVQLAALLGVVSMTINRWKRNETRPDLSALSRYDRIVELIVNNTRVRK